MGRGFLDDLESAALRGGKDGHAAPTRSIG